MSPGIGVGVGLPFVHLQRRGGFSPASLFSSGEEGAWYDPSDLSTLWQDAAGTTPVTAADQPVGRIDDKSGNGNHATQSTAGSRPLYKTAGGLHWLEGDGVDDLLMSVLSAAVDSPSFGVAVGLEQVTFDSVNAICGWETYSGLYFGFSMNADGKPVYRLFDFGGAGSVSTAFSSEQNPAVLVGNFGAAGSAEANGVAYAGIPTTAIDRDPARITMFSNGLGSGSFANHRNFGMVAIDRAFTTAEIAALRTYLAGKSGVTL